MNDEPFEAGIDLSEVSDEDLFSEYDRISRNLFGRYPEFPTRLSTDYVYFTMLADELGKRGYDLRGVDGVEVYEKEYGTPLPDFIEEGMREADKVEEEVDLSDPAGVVREFCNALIKDDYGEASVYCYSPHFNDLVEDTYGGPGKITGIGLLKDCIASREFYDEGAIRYCNVKVKVMWDYGGGPEPEELDFKLANIDGDWKVVKPENI